jgi:hypothetical protein
MKVQALIDLLREFDAEDTVAIGRSVLLGGGLSAIINTGDLYVFKVSNTVVLHTEKPKEGPEWQVVKGEENNGLNDAVVTSFE